MPFIERLRAVLAILLLVGAALFLVGVAVERAAIANESSSAAHPSSTESPHHVEGSGAEGTGTEGSGTEAGQPATPAPESHNNEAILGINVESWPLAIAAAIVSIGIALAAWRGRQRAILFAVAVFALAFTVLDIREVIHQSSEGRTGIVILASLIALVHLAAAALAAAVATRTAPQAVTT
jgi:hypothetical protein